MMTRRHAIRVLGLDAVHEVVEKFTLGVSLLGNYLNLAQSAGLE